MGTEPTARSTWLPRTTRPSSQWTATPVADLFHARRPGALEQLDAPAQQLVLERGGHLGVLVRQDVLAADDQAHLRPDRAEHVDELDPGHPRAHHDQVLGELGGRVGLAGGQDPVAVGDGPVGYPGAAAGRDDDGVGLQLLLGAVRDATATVWGPSRRASPRRHAHALGREQLLDRALQAGSDVADAGRRAS